jgi:hypothetical protein
MTVTNPFEYLGSEVITVLRAPIVVSARDNSERPDWTAAVGTDYGNCMVQPFLMSNKLVIEDNAERMFAQSFYRIWMPSGTDVLYSDRLVWRGRHMDVFGQAGEWFDFEGNSDHIQLLGKLREG